ETRNTSILACPECEKALINIGSKVERIHPVVRFIDRYEMQMVAIWWTLTLLGLGYGIGEGMGNLRSAGFGGVAVMVVPHIVFYFVRRLFPLYRVTDCPYCGFHAEQRLGHSSLS
ncbi:MAG: hypothetical protein ACQKBY_01485, partial [Verrucomicrobiales bacterium]